MTTGSIDFRRTEHDGTGVRKRVSRRAKLETVKRLVSAIISPYDFRFTLPDGNEVSSRCTDPDARRTDIHLHDDVAVSAFLSMSHSKLYEAFTGQNLDVIGHLEDVMRWAADVVKDPSQSGVERVAKLLSLKEFLRPTKYRTEALKTHYSFPPEFYLSWLGDDQFPVFSQYVFEGGETASDWKQARERKLRYMLEVCELEPGSRLLEIGGGWGGSLRFMTQRGIHVTSITLEQNSVDTLQRVTKEEGAEDRCQALMADFYTYEDEPFDAIINCGITEHLLDYGAVMDQYCKLVKPGGVIYSDFSAKPDPAHRISSVTRKYIYPASDLVDLPRFLHEQGQRSDSLELEQIHNDRDSYAKTSRSWARALEQREDDLVTEFGEYPYRMFRYFHWACTIGFEHNIITAYRVVIRRRAKV
jgi:cyclopropane-fatty-acyl-phospholipid synthase